MQLVDPLRRLESGATDQSEAFFALQKGAWVVLPKGGTTVVEFGRLILGLSREKFFEEVKTIMLNGKVVDQPETCTPEDGDTLVFSGAMPGLVGAMLRSDSPLKAMRGPVTESDSDRSPEISRPVPYPGLIRLKAFNTVLRDHLDDILSWGASIGLDADA